MRMSAVAASGVTAATCVAFAGSSTRCDAGKVNTINDRTPVWLGKEISERPIERSLVREVLHPKETPLSSALPPFSVKDTETYIKASLEEVMAANVRRDGWCHAVHAMIYCTTSGCTIDGHPCPSVALMIVRDDGRIGFPGGGVDPGETVTEALARELKEEIGAPDGLIVPEQKHRLSIMRRPYSKCLLNFFAIEVSEQDLLTLEKSALECRDWGKETFGIVRAPLGTF